MPTPSSKPSRKLAALVSLAVVVSVAWWLLGDSLSLASLAAQESALREEWSAHPVRMLAAAFALYVLVTGLSLPGATLLTLGMAWLFGFGPALVLVSFASTAGATVAFLISRYFLSDWGQGRFGERLAGFNESLQREGAFYLFSLRLIPVVPFFVINLVMGLTPVRVRTFWWVSQLGMLPGTAVYVYAGSQFPTLQALANQGPQGILTPGLIGAFVALGLFPLLVRKLILRFKRVPCGGNSDLAQKPQAD